MSRSKRRAEERGGRGAFARLITVYGASERSQVLYQDSCMYIQRGVIDDAVKGKRTTKRDCFYEAQHANENATVPETW